MAERRYEIFERGAEVIITDQKAGRPGDKQLIAIPLRAGSVLLKKWEALADAHPVAGDAFVDGAMSMYLEFALQMGVIGVRHNG
jgi:hypothetical protein